MSKLVLLLALTVALSACNPYAEYQAKNSVREQLKDPESARFSDIETAGNGLLVCGNVNAKNSMGGYVGDRAFMIWGDVVLLASDDSDSIKLSTCCTYMTQAVNLQKDSSEVDGLEYACSDYINDGFAWPKH